MRRLLALIPLVFVSAALGGTSTRSPVAFSDLAQFDNVQFITVCAFSHFGPNDPIVYPRRPGMSHDHSFFGNVSTNAYTTLSSLHANATTCQRPEDTASYWAPTLLDDNQRVTPDDAAVYYRRSTIAPVHAFPQGFKMIAGNSHARSPQSLHVVYWNCSADNSSPSITPPTCPTPTLHVHVRFPDCWDGTRIDSPDHKSHMAYSVNGVCPASHPVATPQITVVIQYPVTGGKGFQLSSFGVYSGHADFFNGWNENELTRLTNYCLNMLRACGAV